MRYANLLLTIHCRHADKFKRRVENGAMQICLHGFSFDYYPFHTASKSHGVDGAGFVDWQIGSRLLGWLINLTG